MFRTCATVAAALVSFVVVAARAELPTPQKITWPSEATGTPLAGLVYSPPFSPPRATIVYQKNLSVPRIGRDNDDAIVSDLVEAGNLVLVLDYAHHANAKPPALNADSLALRRALTGKTPTLLAGRKVDANHIYLLAEGFWLVRDVMFAIDGKRTLAMDIAYPANPAKPVPLLIEFSCDNANRMGSGSLIFCRDTLLDGAMAAGFAVAMADHPVTPPYKGLDDPVPAVFDRAKDAVATARDFGNKRGLSGKIGVIGFSRGGPIAAVLAVTNKPPIPRVVSTDVQAALVHGNRYDYLDLLPADPMAVRFKKAWGDPTTQPTKWAEHGAAFYLTDAARVAPMFLNTSRRESPEYQDGLAKFHTRLTAMGVEHVYQVDDDQRGHQVTTDPKTLAAIYEFFETHLR